MGDPRDAVKQELEKLLFKVHELEVTLGNLNPSSRETLEEKLLGYAAELGRVQKCTNLLAEYRVPVSLLEAVDQGVNPDSFTTATFKRCLEENQVSKGKVVAIETLREKLLKETAQEFPKLAAAYRVHKVGPPVKSED